MFATNQYLSKDLIAAIKEHDIQKVKEFLFWDCYEGGPCSRLTDEEGRNLAHLAALYANKELFELIYEHLKKHNQLQQFKKLDNEDRYPLHHACLANTYEIILRIIQIIDLDANKQLTSVDKNPFLTNNFVTFCFEVKTPGGWLPVDYLDCNQVINILEKLKLKDEFELIQLDHSILPLSQPLRLHTLLSRYSSVDKETLGKLYLACLIVNLSRMIIKSSNTHPDRNVLTEDEQKQVATQITDMRKEKKIRNETGDTQQILTALGNRFDLFKKYRKGNCEEFADLTTLFSLNFCPELAIEKQAFTKGGDHVWAKSGNLYIDGWSGDSFHEEKENRLKNFWRKRDKNFIGPANLNRYKIETALTIKLQDAKDSPVTIDFLALAMLDYEGDIRQIRFDIIKDLIMLGEHHLSAFKRMMSRYRYVNSILHKYVNQNLNCLFLRAADRGDIPLMDYLLSERWIRIPSLVLDAFLKTTDVGALKFLWQHPSLSKFTLDQQCAIFIRKYPEHKQALDCYQMLFRHKEAFRAAESKEHSLFAAKNDKLKQFLCQTLPDSPFEITSQGIVVKESQIFCIQSLVDKIRQNDDKQIEDEDRQFTVGF